MGGCPTRETPRVPFLQWEPARPHRQHPRRPRLAHILPPPIRRGWQPCHPLPPQRRLAGALPPRLLPGGSQRKDQFAYVPCPRPVPALHAKDHVWCLQPAYGCYHGQQACCGTAGSMRLPGVDMVSQL